MTRWWCVRLCNKTSPTSPVQCEVVFTRKEQEPIKSKSDVVVGLHKERLTKSKYLGVLEFILPDEEDLIPSTYTQ
ncbi:hypothetical protein J6590_100873 [Homalodisca vitripennis]|nr:hypothetical protein J6590_100873 [Homalodisca vitripennis]